MKSFKVLMACILIASSLCTLTCKKRSKGSRLSSISADFLNQINNQEELNALANMAHSGDTNINWVKFMSLTSNVSPQVYFQNSNKYNLHVDFASKHLDGFRGMDAKTFNEKTLYAGRMAYVGTFYGFETKLSESSSSWEWGIQIVSQDPLTSTEIKDVFTDLEKVTLVAGQKTPYLIPTNEQKAHFATIEGELNGLGIKIRPYESFIKNGGKDCYSTGWGIGRLVASTSKTIDAQFKSGQIKETDIVVIDEILAEMPPVAGLISKSVSVPSSHTALLFKQASKPFAFISDPSEITSIEGKIGQNVFLDVNAQNNQCSYYMLTQDHGVTEKWTKFFQEKRIAKVSKPPERDVTTTRIAPVGTFGREDGKTYGAKAANFSEIARIIGEENTTGGLGIPFYYFEKFLDVRVEEGMPLRDFIKNTLSKHKPPLNMEALTADLETVRNKVMATPIPVDILNQMLDSVISHFGSENQMVFLRSATNAEDGDEFNGAGLYESKSGCPGDDRVPQGYTGPSKCEASRPKLKPFSVSLKTVYASLYSLNAFVNWTKYGIPWDLISMGILVNPFASGLLANGVVVTEGSSSIEVSAQKGTEEVTNPSPGVRPEIVGVMYIDETEMEIARKQNSSMVPSGQFVMTDDEYRQLAGMIIRVKQKYRETTWLNLDFEFLKVAEGKVVLTQVRPIPDSMSASQMKGIPHFVFGGKGLQLRTCEDVGDSAFRTSRSKLSITADIESRFFDSSQRQEDAMKNLIIQVGPTEAETFRLSSLGDGQVSLSFKEGKIDRYQDPDTGMWIKTSLNTFDALFRLNQSSPFDLLENRASTLNETTRIMQNPFGVFTTYIGTRATPVQYRMNHGKSPEGTLEPYNQKSGLSPEEFFNIDRLKFCVFDPQKSMKANLALNFAGPFNDGQSEFVGQNIRISLTQLEKRGDPALQTHLVYPLSFAINGIGGVNFNVANWWAVSYGTSHHNIMEDILIDVTRDDKIDAGTVSRLLTQGIRWIHIHRGFTPDTGIETKNTWKLTVINSYGERRDLGIITSKGFPDRKY